MKGWFFLKTKHIILVILGLALLVGSTAVVGSAKGLSPFRYLGGLMAANHSNPHADEIIATIDGQNVTLADLLDAKASLQAEAQIAGKDPASITNKEAFQSVIIPRTVQVAEAKRRGITVSDAEVNAMANKQKSLMANPSVSNEHVYNEIVSGLGGSCSDFWTQIQAPLDRDAFYVTKLRKLEFGSSAPATEGPATEVQVKQREEAYNQLVQNLIKNANIKIIDKSQSLE